MNEKSGSSGFPESTTCPRETEAKLSESGVQLSDSSDGSDLGFKMVTDIHYLNIRDTKHRGQLKDSLLEEMTESEWCSVTFIRLT